MSEDLSATPHKSGFVSLVGKPNAGKSTLLNGLVGQQLAIITPKAQTTRHRILGIVNEDDHQIIFTDTPGLIEPKYELQNRMMRSVTEALEDADLLLVVTALDETFSEQALVERLQKVSMPVMVLINKIDLAKDQEKVMSKIEEWKTRLPNADVTALSALLGFNLEGVRTWILDRLPEHPGYFPKDTLTDRPERFFAAELIREQIMLLLDQEVPYACEVVITEFIEEDILRIRAEIYVERDSQKGILIGKGGEMLRKIGMGARKKMETFFGRKVFLEQFVKVDANWRETPGKLNRLGYR